jgi:hypothetical protein
MRREAALTTCRHVEPDGKRISMTIAVAVPEAQKGAGVSMSYQESVAPDTVFAMQEAIRWHVTCSLGKAWRNLSAGDLFTTVALAVRDQLVERFLASEEPYQHTDPKRLYYLSTRHGGC